MAEGSWSGRVGERAETTTVAAGDTAAPEKPWIDRPHAVLMLDIRQWGAAEQKTGLSLESREPVDSGRMNIKGVSNCRDTFSF